MVKVKIFLTAFVIITLAGCAINTSEYLDDNLSDRMLLAKKTLTEDHVYFDTSKYGNWAVIGNADAVEINLVDIPSGSFKELVKSILKSVETKTAIAVSGRDSKHTAQTLFKALHHINKIDMTGHKILYIGNKKHLAIIEEIALLKRIDLLFASIPPTSD